MTRRLRLPIARRSRQEAPGPGRPAQLWRDRRFAVFLTAQTLSVAGDSFALIAVPLLVLRATGSVAQMGLLTGAAGIAAVLAGIFAGLLADRLDRWILMALKHDLHQGDGVVGLVLAVAALGTVAGALTVAPLRRRLGFGTCWTGAVIVSALAIAGLGATGSVPPTAVLAALYLGCASVAGICSMSLRQEVTPDHLLGRVTAAFWTIHFSLGPLGAALLTWAAGHYGVMAACVASGATCLVIGTIGLVTLARRPTTRPGATVVET